MFLASCRVVAQWEGEARIRPFSTKEIYATYPREICVSEYPILDPIMQKELRRAYAAPRTRSTHTPLQVEFHAQRKTFTSGD